MRTSARVESAQEFVQRLSSVLEALSSDQPGVLGFDLGNDPSGGAHGLPAGIGQANKLRASIAWIRAPLDDSDSLQVVYELGHRGERHSRLRRELCKARPLRFDVGSHVRVRHACALEPGGDQPIEQLGLK